MKLSEHPLGIEWLRQFDIHDIHAARLFLDSLKLVSLDECETAISSMLEEVLSNESGIAAIFTIDKKLIDPNSAPGSEDRLAHLISNLKRQFGDRILNRPSVAEMRENKVRQIVLIDDFVGSGQRILEFWQAWACKTLKSWLSNGLCSLWLVGYAVHQSGLRDILKRINSIKLEHTLFEITLRAGRLYWPDALLDFCERNGERTEHSRWPLGFGDLMCPLVFRHGCPDNCAAILWSNGPDFRALFPGRSIASSFSHCFSTASDDLRNSELLWKTGQFKLALSIIEKLEKGWHDSRYISLLTVLGLLRRGVKRENLSEVMTFQNSKIEKALNSALELGLISESFAVTPFGCDLLDRSKKVFIAPKSTSSPLEQDNIIYFPQQFQHQFCGVQQKSRDEPT